MIKTQNDWHPADIIAALRKRGTALTALLRESGFSSSTLSNTLARQWPKGEKIIVDRLGIAPSVIWPSRYFDKNGNSIKRNVRNCYK
ncbi:helix-turn-helix domain-containing protein [Photorhabdus heterorhabditis]|uniref:Transcriptional regulator n=1 Tax=Photorhabdus heterorhabditis TaxID=880156 RepID=A0A5B0X8P7_9GAMM|nr:helix-turn-helix transcriptional regulator [Photorhabdus heterorhabditis]KAA1195764.1 transcriptional regulator [Photorhabdus heterorhabditis]MBS9441233.1 transcriptional regulator [Photorhabdus heterorhabditis]